MFMGGADIGGGPELSGGMLLGPEEGVEEAAEAGVELF